MVNLGMIGGLDPDPLGYASSSAAAINDGGQIVGTSTIPVVPLAVNADRAFLYTEGVMHDLNTLVVSGLDA